MSVVAVAIAAAGGFILDLPSEVGDWVESFKKTLASGRPTDIIFSLVQMGLANPVACDCDKEYGEDYLSDGIWRWLHEHHREYNRIFWELISSEIFPKLRRVLNDDLRVFSDENDKWRQEWVDAHGTADGYQNMGKIVLHDFARQLLDHFLWADESKADWI